MAMQQQPQQQNMQNQQLDPNAANAQSVEGPAPGSITGDPALDQALAETMNALPQGGDQIMANLLTALQPYLVQQDTSAMQANPLAKGAR